LQDCVGSSGYDVMSWLTKRAQRAEAEVEELRAAYDDLWANANEAFNRLANHDPDEAYAALRRSLRKGGGE
jgi:hypothetical protein